MTRFIYLILILAAAALCFFSGYKLGQMSANTLTISETIDDGTAIGQLSDTVDTMQDEADTLAVEPSSNPLELRAQESIQTFFDTNERKLVAEILEVHADSLKVRRQADGRDLPGPLRHIQAPQLAVAARPATSGPA